MTWAAGREQHTSVVGTAWRAALDSVTGCRRTRPGCGTARSWNLATYRFLPGEFDYFLTQQGVTREQVLHGIQDVEAKAHLEDGMDERRTGEDGYRRPLEQARAMIPERPGRPIEPFGYTSAEGRRFTGRSSSREPLGRAPRQFRKTGGATTKRPNELIDRTERITRAVLRLPEPELRKLIEAIQNELNTRIKS